MIDDTTQSSFDLTAYPDTYTERLNELIEAKVEGKEVVAAPAMDAPPVINLMDALKASVAQAQQQTGKKSATKGSPLKKKVAKTKRKTATKSRSSSGKALKEKLSAPKKPRKTAKRKKKTG